MLSSGAADVCFSIDYVSRGVDTGACVVHSDRTTLRDIFLLSSPHQPTMEDTSPSGRPIIDREKVCNQLHLGCALLTLQSARPHRFSYAPSSKLAASTASRSLKMDHYRRLTNTKSLPGAPQRSRMHGCVLLTLDELAGRMQPCGKCSPPSAQLHPPRPRCGTRWPGTPSVPCMRTVQRAGG